MRSYADFSDGESSDSISHHTTANMPQVNLHAQGDPTDTPETPSMDQLKATRDATRSIAVVQHQTLQLTTAASHHALAQNVSHSANLTSARMVTIQPGTEIQKRRTNGR